VNKYFFEEVNLLCLHESIIGIIESVALRVVHETASGLPDSWLRLCLEKCFFDEVSLLRLHESIIGIIGSAALGVVHKSTRSLPDSWLRQCKNRFFREAKLSTFARINNGIYRIRDFRHRAQSDKNFAGLSAQML
jgi:hypothetical protein